MRTLEPLPATRFNFDAALQRAAELGSQLAPMIQRRDPFTSLEERPVWYDSLPYLGLSRAGARDLLADLTTIVLPSNMQTTVPFGLARADALSAAGRQLESLTEITRISEAGVKAFEKK